MNLKMTNLSESVAELNANVAYAVTFTKYKDFKLLLVKEMAPILEKIAKDNALDEDEHSMLRGVWLKKYTERDYEKSIKRMVAIFSEIRNIQRLKIENRRGDEMYLAHAKRLYKHILEFEGNDFKDRLKKEGIEAAVLSFAKLSLMVDKREAEIEAKRKARKKAEAEKKKAEAEKKKAQKEEKKPS